jgi:hypothetical protein
MSVTALWASAVTAMAAMTARHVQARCSCLFKVRWSRLLESIASAASDILLLLLQLSEKYRTLIYPLAEEYKVPLP